MAVTAKQLTTTSATIFTPTNQANGEVTIQNLGPNPIYIQVGGGAAAVATGLQIASGASYTCGMKEVITGYCATLQVTPSDTRVSIERK